jgi:hypothetical protein
MKLRLPKVDEKFLWTLHAREKMEFYRLSPARVLRAFHNPHRVEEGIAPKTIAVMQPLTPKHTSEVWLMYQVDKRRKKIKVITAWRYPARSPIGKAIPIPEEIKKELKLK